ncbi:hypothetical protein O9992_22655 [Vibrio lentus]|nr:hypothetical protein [Vibrio lentus]
MFNKGDFRLKQMENTPTNLTKEGQVCLTVSSDALYFTKGVSQLFNPSPGKYIY